MGQFTPRQVLGQGTRRGSGLLSNGEEESKGNELTREAHRLLEDASP